MKKAYWITGILAIFLAIGIFAIASPDSNAGKYELVNAFDKDIMIYKSSTCGCCELYASYFKKQGNPNADIYNVNIDDVKKDYKIPKTLESCHTTIIGDYFVEGHIPLEAIEKLLKEKPEIRGIAMPGMPSGSPGMPGVKSEFVIYKVNFDGSYDEFMRM